MNTYAIISVGGKQYRVREGETLLVDRLAHGEGKTFNPAVLLVGGGGSETQISPKDFTVTARVVADVKGEKIRIGKYRPKNGYKKHTGFRASLSEIQIESIGGKKRAETAKPKAEPAAPKAEAPKAEAPKAEAPKAEAPKAAAGKLPAGYEELTVAAIKEGAASWKPAEIDAALEHERAHGNRKGAIAALESAKESS
jgi:large subunit ribosomal protein L21